MANSKIRSCKIFPGIGIARVGDSAEGFFIGPESPGLGPDPGTSFKDVAGSINRQAARFRIYGYDRDGKVVQEINALTPGARIEWKVTIANKKSSGFRFAGVQNGLALDKNPDPEQLRNKSVFDRKALEISPSSRTISGVSRSGSQFAFDDGEFCGKAVYLGELRTDDAGRLVVLGGRGKSSSVPGSRPITQYANNDGWHDDTSDGVVAADIVLDGQRIPLVADAWVIVAPPKFAPYLRNIVTLHEVMAEAKGIAAPEKLSFTFDIYPLFSNFADLQWVNQMSLRGHGPQKAGSFQSPKIIEKLNDSSEANRPFRSSILARLRDPVARSVGQANYNFMPLLSGDEGDAIVDKPETWLSLTKTTYSMLQRWAAGDFAGDWPGSAPEPATLDSMPVDLQPEALNRASLEFCVGGPFFPGIEITYIARYPDYYIEPFRFDSAKIQPGDITRRMAVPWQADFFECQMHWWPAQRPDDVLNEQSYRQALLDFPTQAKEGKLAQAATGRIRWDRGVGDHWGNPETEIPPGARPARPGDNDLVDKWKAMGFVKPVRTPAGETLQVETGRSRFDGLSDREYFFYLMNIDSYPDFLTEAKRLAESFLARAAQILDDPTPGAIDDFYRYFPYSKDAFSQRLDEIYAYYENAASADPIADPGNPFLTKEDMVERIRQFAPLNQLDGAWVRNVAKAGPIDEVGALLFSVWMDEVGDGNPEQNHANLYTNLLEKIGIHLPPINSQDYALHSDLLDSAYTVPVFELAISQFTQTFFPEILGMTLQLEWEVLALWPTVKLLRNFGFDAHFYELHIGIDNAANGHGAKARQAVDRFIDDARKRGGEEEAQAVWRRIWVGYVAFATTGTLGQDLRDLLQQRRDNPPSPADKVAEIMEAKKKYGSLNHGQKKLGGQLINDLFEDPAAFTSALVSSGHIVPGHPDQSSFFELTSFDGPMYRVFTDEELQTWSEWVFWLSSKQQDQPVETDPAKLMAACIDHFRAEQQGTPMHALTNLTGPDPGHPGQTLTQPVSAWMDEPAAAIMAALADDQNHLIVLGNSAGSSFLTKIVGADNSMGRAFASVAPNTNGKTWTRIVADWIDAGCPLPVTAAQAHLAVAGTGPAVRLTITASFAEIDRHPRGRIQGMGVVH